MGQVETYRMGQVGTWANLPHICTIAGPRKSLTKCCKRGRTRILTDILGKEEIRLDRERDVNWQNLNDAVEMLDRFSFL